MRYRVTIHETVIYQETYDLQKLGELLGRDLTGLSGPDIRAALDHNQALEEDMHNTSLVIGQPR